MNLQEVIKTARTEEYWKMHLDNVSNTENVSLFETQIKDKNTVTTEKVLLSKKAVTKVAELCNHSNVLIYNFYLTVFSILGRNYQKDMVLLSPTDQFDHVEAKDELFFIQPKLLSETTFKKAFSSQKEQLVQHIEFALPWKIVQQYFTNEGLLEEVHPCSFIIGESSHIEAFETEFIKTIFKCVLDTPQPYIEIAVKGTVYDTKLLTLFGENFNTTLQEVLDKTYEPIENLQFRSSGEIEILQAVNTAEPYFSLDENIIEVISKQCKLFADKIAIKHNEEEVTFSALEKYTNQFAAYLLDTFQAKTDDLFGIMMPRSPRITKSILSVWKAGSAYVPIGIELPDDNLLQIIENSNLNAIITDDEVVLAQLSRLNISTPIINLNTIQKTLESISAEAVSVTIQPNDLAYVIYTSGSTGIPKGVMIEHIGMLNHMGAKIHEIGIDSESIISQNAPHTFDISIWQMFVSLMTGGQCIIYDNDDIVDVEKFSTSIEKDQITVLELVPSYLLEMLHYIEGERNTITLQLNNIILNAETLTKSMVKRWLALYPNIPIINTYGATEVSDDTSHYFMESVPENYSVPVMTVPIQHFEVHIVNEKMQQVPIGVKGEILLVGPCVGRGYFNDDEKTKKAFLQGPIEGLTSQKRIYKTGDSGRFNADGTMEFMGRNDNQVKILGHRIELDSIENIATEIEGIKNVKAVAFIEKQMIVLYYMSETEISKELINNKLAAKLPKYMLPAAYMHMQRFPLTKNGKIDKKALPIPENDNGESSSEFIAPVTELEKQVAEIWKKVLEVNTVGINDIFFDLGGHSLKVMRLKNEYQKIFNIKIELRQLFENPQLASHCTIIEASSRASFVTIEPVEIQENYPLSNAQQRLWVLSQFQEGSAAYNIPYTVPIQIEDLELFKKAIYAVVDRHEVLRTIFKENAAGEIRQWIVTQNNLNFQIEYKEVTDQAAVEQFIAADSFIPFDLENGPLIRATLLKTSTDNYTFYFNMHHIISDGWSMEVLAKDVFAYYDYYMGKVSEEPIPLRIQYKDYAAWHLAQLETEPYEVHKNYWISQLEERIPVLNLPSSKVRPTIKTYNGEGYKTYISTENSQKLRDYVGKEGGSLYVGLLALCNIMLHQYTSETDISIGVPVAGRDHSDLEDQIGFYINTITLRNQVHSNQSFTEFFNILKENTVTAFGHQMYPFDRLLEDLNITGIAGRNPLSDVLVDHNLALTQSIPDIENTGITNLGKVLAKYDIEFHFTEAENGIIFQVNYNTDVYEGRMVQQFIQHFKQLLETVLTAPTKTITEISCLSENEQNHLLTTLNNTEVNLPDNTSVIDLFLTQVEKHPEKTALQVRGKDYSYAELDSLSNKLAQCLIEEQGINSESIVALKLDRNEWLLISILAVLKSGATYLPIDIKTVAEREEFILEDAAVELLICSSDFMFDTDFAGNIFAIDIEFDAAQYENVAVNHIKTWEASAYIIYTSGSTGKPKGTVIGHKSLTNYLLWSKKEYLNNTETPSFGLFTSIAFDLTVTSLFLPLISGGSLTTYNASNDISTILKSYFDNSHTCIKLTPAHITVLQTLDLQSDQLQVAIVGGDALHPSHVETLHRINPNIKIYNEYGPTEATVGCVVYEVTSKDEIYIGKPIQNTQVYVLDANNQLVADGVAGELCISGVGLAQGYLNNIELTNEKFINHPFKSGEKLYKTGDLVKWIDNEHLHFIGRTDHQVKIRGHRIELGEIEQQIAEKESIHEVAVLVKDETAEEKELIAYMTSSKEETITEIRSYLAARVPEYMIPSSFVQIETFPLTINGKIDKNKLSSVEGTRLESNIEYVAPTNDTEEKLVAIWEEVLGEEKVGIKDNFFALGGNSIKAIKLLTLINKTFEVDINITDVFNDTTIENIAIKIEFIKGQEKLKDSKEMYKEIKL